MCSAIPGEAGPPGAVDVRVGDVFDAALVRSLLRDATVLWLFLVPPMLARLRPLVAEFLATRPCDLPTTSEPAPRRAMPKRRVLSYRSPIVGLAPAKTDEKMALYLYEAASVVVCAPTRAPEIRRSSREESACYAMP
mmetsp:Transcript_23689/g.93945  ORF Transcript_23689/g.93945 Transcript_23689/m.93945 type:complete len:137 (-) Transcript_23689:936-1346(-)